MSPDIIDAIKFDETQVDIEAIMRQIRQYLAQKQGTAVVSRTEEQSPTRFRREVYDELFEANHDFDKVRIAPYLTPVRMPIIGALWQRLRSALHALVVFYVDRAADAQVRFNSHVVRVLNGIVEGIDSDRIPDRLGELERRVEALEKRVHSPGAGPNATGPREQGDA